MPFSFYQEEFIKRKTLFSIFRFVLFSVFTLFVFSACDMGFITSKTINLTLDDSSVKEEHENEELENEEAEEDSLEVKRLWSILVYMSADNNLEAAAIEDMLEMESSN